MGTIVCFGAVQANSAGPINGKPNIIFILTDDLGFGDVGAFYQNERRTNGSGHGAWTQTPHLDAMAAEGAKLRQHYCGAPVCAPSRASLFLGVGQGHASIRNNQFDKALENNHNVATVLKAAGYSTALIGKWGLQGKGTDAASWPAYPTKRGFDYYLGYVRHGDEHEHYPKEGVYQGRKQVWENEREISETLDKCYTADLFTAGAKKWIVDHQKEKKAEPFFLFLAFDTPHAVQEYPAQAYPPGGGRTGGLQWVGKPGGMINTASGAVDSWCHPDYQNATYSEGGSNSPTKPWPEVYKRYATAIRRVDDCVGDLLQLLRDLRIETNTLVVFSSDNGPSIESYLKERLAANFFNSFGPFDGIKRDLWEGGWRVPTIAWWPGRIPANGNPAEPSQQHDWLATFAEAAGVPTPARSDGVSLMPMLTGREQTRKPVIYSEYYHNLKTPEYEQFASAHRGRLRGQMQTIRIGKYVGVRYDVKSHADDFEIYDVMADPGERDNLAKRPECASVQQQMKDAVLGLRRPDGGASRPYDNELIPGARAGSVERGVRYEVFPGEFPWVPELSAMHAAHSGVTQAADGMALGTAEGGILYSGYINAPRDGEYSFYLNAEGKALMRVHEATVIDADFGYTSGSEKSGAIRLKSGKHPFRLYYVRPGVRAKTGSSALKLAWSGPGIVKQAMPEEAFMREIR